MKKITLVILLLNAVLSNAQTITQSTSLAIESGTVSCNNTGVASAANSYFRAFNLSTYGITTAYNVTAVTFGIQVISGVTTYPITVKLYSTTATFPTGFPTGYTLLATQTYDIPAQVSALYTAPIAGTVPANSKLVVEVGYAGAGTGVSASVFLGSNNDGQSGPTYIVAPVCNIATPTTMAAINFADVHLVMSVDGNTLGVNQSVLDKIAFYPNPVQDILHFDLPHNVTLNKAFLADITGKQILLPTAGNSVNISNFESGVYFLTLETSEGNVTRKVIKA